MRQNIIRQRSKENDFEPPPPPPAVQAVGRRSVTRSNKSSFGKRLFYLYDYRKQLLHGGCGGYYVQETCGVQVLLPIKSKRSKTR